VPVASSADSLRSLPSVAVHPTRPAEQLDDPEVGASPFRAAFVRARLEAFTATGPTPEPGRHADDAASAFEYRLLKRRGKRFAEEAAWNELGRRGWELVGVTSRHAAFKRPV
jgi:hypothetical protein